MNPSPNANATLRLELLQRKIRMHVRHGRARLFFDRSVAPAETH
jgi:hypothetical protein